MTNTSTKQCYFCGKAISEGEFHDDKFFCNSDHYLRFVESKVSFTLKDEFSYIARWVLDAIMKEGEISLIKNNRFFILLNTGESIATIAYETKDELVDGIAYWKSIHGEGSHRIEGVYDKESKNKIVKYSAIMQVTIED